MRQLLLTYTAIISCFGLFAQQLDFENYSVEDGLARSGVYNLIQDDNGLLVIGTEGGGVCFFDGVRFRTFNKNNGLIDNNVRRVFQDSEGGYWFGTPSGVTYLGASGLQNYTQEDGLEDNFVRYIEEDNDKNVWISTNNGVSVINLDQFKLEKKSKFNFSLPHRRVRTLLFDGNNMWFGTDAGLCKLEDDGKLRLFTTIDGLSDNRILCLNKGQNGEILVGTNSGLVIMKNGKVVETYTTEDGLQSDRVRAIAVNQKGAIYLGTRHGFSIINRGQRKIITLTEGNGLSNDRIRNILIDDHENVWIGTYFGGIMKYTPGDFCGIAKSEGLVSNMILNLFEDENGHIIIGTIDGVNKLHFENNLISEIRTISEKDGLIFPEVNYLCKDKKGFYWYGTSSGISVFNGNEHVRNITTEDDLIDTDVNLIKEVNPDELWIGTVDGLSIIEVVNREPFQFKIKSFTNTTGLSGRMISFIEEDKEGNVLVGYKKGRIDVFTDQRIMKPKQVEALNEINTGYVDSKNNIWVGTEGEGLFKLKYLKESVEIQSRRYNTDQGLVSNYIYSIVESKKGNLWIGTEKGVSKLVLDASKEIAYVRNYGPQDGFKGMECNMNSILCSKDGNIWFGTVRGIQYLMAEEEDGVKKEAVIHITGIQTNELSFDWFTSAAENGIFKAPNNIEMKYHDNFIEINFKALYLSSPSKIKYSWKFKNQEEWTEFSNKDYIHFTNLDPGTYTIQIRSKTPENVISEEPVEFTFTVIEPFYMNIWFRVLMVLVVIGIGYMLYVLRVRNLKKQKLALEQIVEERTEEISAQNEQLSAKNKEITDSINYAKRIQDTIIPTEETLKSFLGTEAFVLFKPKDIVSGDFYWIRQIDENTTIFCVADCTGHGVPGAMVSLVGVEALNKAVGEFQIYKPSEILDKVNILLNEAFSSEGKSVADGMDIALCKLTKKGSEIELEYSGGNNPLWVFNPEREVIPQDSRAIHNEDDDTIGFEIKPNKFGLGKDYAEENFTNHVMQLEKGDEIIIFTDGYADQFGGKSISDKPMGKKFKYSRLKQLIFQVYANPADEQRETLDGTIEAWRGELEQIDDICLMGVKV